MPIPEGMTERMTRALWDEGVTTYYPTVITNSSENITQAVRAIAQACDRDPLTQASVHGIHLEGPFISPEDGARGAHNLAYVQAPSWDSFQRWPEAAGGSKPALTAYSKYPSTGRCG